MNIDGIPKVNTVFLGFFYDSDILKMCRLLLRYLIKWRIGYAVSLLFTLLSSLTTCCVWCNKSLLISAFWLMEMQLDLKLLARTWSLCHEGLDCSSDFFLRACPSSGSVKKEKMLMFHSLFVRNNDWILFQRLWVGYSWNFFCFFVLFFILHFLKTPQTIEADLEGKKKTSFKICINFFNIFALNHKSSHL